MPRSVPVSTGPAALQGKVDHRPQYHRRGEGVLASERFGGRCQNLVVISINFFRAFEHKACRSVEGRPSHEKAQSLEEVRRSLGIVECLFLDLDFIEIRQLLQIRPEVDGGQGSLKTIPSARLGRPARARALRGHRSGYLPK